MIMAEENEATVYTDFDNTMVAQHSAKRLLARLFMRKPGTVIRSVLLAFLQSGTGGAAFVQALARLDNKLKEEVALSVVRNLSFNDRWLRSLKAFIEKYPRIMNIKLIVITRNIELIPKLFVHRVMDQLRALTGGRFKGDLIVIGNGGIGTSALYRLSDNDLTLPLVINTSADKVPFIRKNHAFYFGDPEEYRELARDTRLKNLHFFRV